MSPGEQWRCLDSRDASAALRGGPAAAIRDVSDGQWDAEHWDDADPWDAGITPFV